MDPEHSHCPALGVFILVFDEMGFLTTSKPEAKKLMEQAREFLDKAGEASLRGRTHEAAEWMQRAAYLKRDIDAEFAKETPLQHRAHYRLPADARAVSRRAAGCR